MSVYVLMMILSQIECFTEYKIKLIFIYETLSQPLDVGVCLCFDADLATKLTVLIYILNYDPFCTGVTYCTDILHTHSLLCNLL